MVCHSGRNYRGERDNDDAANLQPLAVAKLLAKIAAKENPDLVIVGKQVREASQLKWLILMSVMCMAGYRLAAYLPLTHMVGN